MLCDFLITVTVFPSPSHLTATLLFFELNVNDQENFQDEEFRFQQDGAIYHTARQSREVVREIFPLRLILLLWW